MFHTQEQSEWQTMETRDIRTLINWRWHSRRTFLVFELEKRMKLLCSSMALRNGIKRAQCRLNVSIAEKWNLCVCHTIHTLHYILLYAPYLFVLYWDSWDSNKNMVQVFQKHFELCLEKANVTRGKQHEQILRQGLLAIEGNRRR